MGDREDAKMHPAERKQNLQRLHHELKRLKEEPVPGVHACVSRLATPTLFASSRIKRLGTAHAGALGAGVVFRKCIPGQTFAASRT